MPEEKAIQEETLPNFILEFFNNKKPCQAADADGVYSIQQVANECEINNGIILEEPVKQAIAEYIFQKGYIVEKGMYFYQNRDN